MWLENAEPKVANRSTRKQVLGHEVIRVIQNIRSSLVMYSKLPVTKSMQAEVGNKLERRFLNLERRLVL